MLRTRRQSTAEPGAAGDAQVAALERENQRLRDLVSRHTGAMEWVPLGPGCLYSNGRGCREQMQCRRTSQLGAVARRRAGQPRLPRRRLAVGTCLPPIIHRPCRLLCLQLAEQTGRGASKSSYLCKYRAHATASLWAPTWELR